MWRRLKRSAAIPPNGANRNTGTWLANPTDPSSRAEPVSRYTSHDCATLCIQVPISEISCPLKKSWKLRWRSARPAACQRDPPPEVASAPLTAGLSWTGNLDSDTFTSFDDASALWVTINDHY